MTSDHATDLLRDPAAPRPISYIELFFDLAFVFALTEVSRSLMSHPTVGGALRSLLLLAAVWWVWTVTAWSTDWFDPDQPFVRGLLVWVMFGGLLLAAAVPQAFGDHALIFAGTYLTIHLGRGAGLIYRLRGHPAARRSARVATWFAITGVAWIAGALAPAAQLPLWALAVFVDATIGLAGYPVPKLGRSTQQELGVIAEHLTERYRQFVIIAIGDLILVSGLSFGAAGFHTSSIAAFALAFATALLFIQIYYLPPGHGLPARGPSATPAHTALAAGYLHLLLLAGILTAGAGHGLVVGHPNSPGTARYGMVLIAGVALFLTWRAVLVAVVWRWLPWWLPVGPLATLAAAPAVARLPPIAASAAAVLVLLATVLAEWSRSRREAGISPA